MTVSPIFQEDGELIHAAGKNIVQRNPVQELAGDWVNMVLPGESLVNNVATTGKARFEFTLTNSNVEAVEQASYVMNLYGNRSLETDSSSATVKWDIYRTSTTLYAPAVVVENRSRVNTVEAGTYLDVDDRTVLWVDIEQGYVSASLHGMRGVLSVSERAMQPGVTLAIGVANADDNMARQALRPNVHPLVEAMSQQIRGVYFPVHEMFETYAPDEPARAIRCNFVLEGVGASQGTVVNVKYEGQGGTIYTDFTRLEWGCYLFGGNPAAPYQPHDLEQSTGGISNLGQSYLGNGDYCVYFESDANYLTHRGIWSIKDVSGTTLWDDLTDVRVEFTEAGAALA